MRATSDSYALGISFCRASRPATVKARGGGRGAGRDKAAAETKAESAAGQLHRTRARLGADLLCLRPGAGSSGASGSTANYTGPPCPHSPTIT
jgi:hypothetical protein